MFTHFRCQLKVIFGSWNLSSIYHQLIFKQHGQLSTFFEVIPLEEKQVEVVVFLGEEVAEDSSGVSTTDLIS